MPHSSPAPRSVILLHRLPDGRSHFDWMIDQPELDHEHRLLCWRCGQRPDLPEQTPFSGFRLKDHRAIYLHYEGPLSGDRGSVSRLARGRVRSLTKSDKEIHAVIDWANTALRYHLVRERDDTQRWHVAIIPVS